MAIFRKICEINVELFVSTTIAQEEVLTVNKSLSFRGGRIEAFIFHV